MRNYKFGLMLMFALVAVGFAAGNPLSGAWKGTWAGGAKGQPSQSMAAGTWKVAR
jgi:hypothetical protein